MDVQEALDEIYAAPLDAFTATRNRVAKELRDGGDEEAAKEVAKLRKPNIAAWATNQLARHAPALVEELMQASDKLRRAQRRVLSGGKPDALRAASDERKRVTAKLVEAARQALEEAGHAAAPATLHSIAGTLTAVASDADAAEAVRRGRLDREIAPQPITDAPGLWLVGDEDDEPDDDSAGDTGDDTRRHDGDLDELRRATTEAKQDAARLQRAADKAATDAGRAEAKAERLAEEAERLKVRAADAERAASAAREEAGFARRTSEAKEQEAERAAAAQAQAERALAKAERK